MSTNEPVKLLVRKVGTKKFLAATGRWTKKAEAAANFPHLYHVIHTCLAKGLDDVELVLRYKGEMRDRRLPLNCA